MSRLPLLASLRFLFSLCVALLCGAAVFAQEVADKPAVIRTMTHHQITSMPRGVSRLATVLSVDGGHIAFAANPAGDGGVHICVTDFEGKKVDDLDQFSSEIIDTNYDGSKVVYSNRRELRIASIGAKKTLVQLNDVNLLCPRITSNGRWVYFLVARDSSFQVEDQASPAPAGVYRIDAEGRNRKYIVGRKEVARLCQVDDAALGYNFRIEGTLAILDISSDGGRVLFGAFVKDAYVLFGCNQDGKDLHIITTTEHGKPNPMVSIVLSGDGSTVGYYAATPNEIGVVGFGGQNRTVLIKDDPGFPFGGDEPIYLTHDGSQLTRTGRNFRTDGKESFQLLRSNGGGVLRYWDSEVASMDPRGVRYAYFIDRGSGVTQLATMELNAPVDPLRGAPRLSDLLIDPPCIPRAKLKPQTYAKIHARVEFAPQNTPGNVTSTGFREGLFDSNISQTFLRDDGVMEGDRATGDLKAGDGVFSSWQLYAQQNTPEGPRSVRVDAQSTDPALFWHGQVVEIGWYPIRDDPPSMPPPEAIPGTPPNQPPPIPPPSDGPEGPVVANPGDGSTDGGSPGSRTGGSGTDPTGSGAGSTGDGSTGAGAGATGSLDLTGLWRDDNGVPYSIRQVGTKIYWSMDGRPRALNVFFGDLSGDTVRGDWTDLPGGELANAGKLALKVQTPDRMVKIEQSIVYGASILTRERAGFGGGAGTGAGGGAGGGSAGPGGGGGPPINGGPCADPRTLGIMDQWLAQAMPPQLPGESLRYEAWGRLVGRSRQSELKVNGKPDTTLSRCEYLWQHAAQLNSTNLGTLKEYVEATLK